MPVDGKRPEKNSWPVKGSIAVFASIMYLVLMLV